MMKLTVNDLGITVWKCKRCGIECIELSDALIHDTEAHPKPKPHRKLEPRTSEPIKVKPHQRRALKRCTDILYGKN